MSSEKLLIGVPKEKIEKLKDDFINDYKKPDIKSIKPFLIDNCLYVNKTNEIKLEIKREEINEFIKKSYFFIKADEIVKQAKYSYYLANKIIQMENTKILTNLIDKSKIISNSKTFFELVVSYENIILIDINNIFDYVKERGNELFIINYNKFNDEEKQKCHNSKYKIFSAFKRDEIFIPIYRFYVDIDTKGILILNKNIFGKLIQYSPANTEEEKKFVKEEFLIQVIDFTKENDINKISKMLGNPDWLKEIGDEKAQLNYLKENVQVKILERFELNLHEDFEGYFFEIKDE